MAVKGLNLTLNALKKYSKEVQEDVKDAVEETTLAIQRKAIDRAPAAGDALKTTFGSQKNSTGINQYISSKFTNNNFTGEVFVDSGATNLAAYIEFGTGRSAAGYVPTLPTEWQEVARKFYINGKGTLIKKPFLLPSYFDEAPKLEKKIRKILKSKKL